MPCILALQLQLGGSVQHASADYLSRSDYNTQIGEVIDILEVLQPPDHAVMNV